MFRQFTPRRGGLSRKYWLNFKKNLAYVTVEIGLDPAIGCVFIQKNQLYHHQYNILESQNHKHILGEITSQ